MPIRPENRDRYPADWPEITHRIKFVRAGGRCECDGRCGRPPDHLGADGRCVNRHGQPAHRTGSRVVLTTAHLDHVPEHCDDDNLAAMCQGCHLHYDRDHHAATRAAGRAAARAAAGEMMLPMSGENETTDWPPTTPTCWAVLAPVLDEVSGVLVTVDGDRIHADQAKTERDVVLRLHARTPADADLVVCHGWAQAPEQVRLAYEAKKPDRVTKVRELTEEDELVIARAREKLRRL